MLSVEEAIPEEAEPGEQQVVVVGEEEDSGAGTAAEQAEATAAVVGSKRKARARRSAAARKAARRGDDAVPAAPAHQQPPWRAKAHVLDHTLDGTVGGRRAVRSLLYPDQEEEEEGELPPLPPLTWEQLQQPTDDGRSLLDCAFEVGWMLRLSRCMGALHA